MDSLGRGASANSVCHCGMFEGKPPHTAEGPKGEVRLIGVAAGIRHAGGGARGEEQVLARGLRGVPCRKKMTENVLTLQNGCCLPKSSKRVA